jgi:hypothetical protein
MRFDLREGRVYLAPVLGLLLAAGLAACSSGGSSSSTTPTTASSSAASSSAAASVTATPASGSSSAASGGSAAAVTAIKTNWETFFNSATPNSKRLTLLENGDKFSAAVAAFASSPLAAGVSSTVTSVKFDSATKATVKYNLSAAGTTVSTGATGSSVLQDGTWKVGDDVFCGLLSQAKAFGLNIPVPSACSSAS